MRRMRFMTQASALKEVTRGYYHRGNLDIGDTFAYGSTLLYARVIAIANGIVTVRIEEYGTRRHWRIIAVEVTQ